VDEKQRAWQNQFVRNIGAVELLRFAGAFMLWLLIGVVIAILIPSPTFSTTIFLSFLLSTFVFSFIGISRRLPYMLVRAIFGNKNLPNEPFPGRIQRIYRQPLPWWAYLPSLWNFILVLALLYIVVRYLTR